MKMSKFKQKLSNKFKNVEGFNYQNWLESWSKDSIDTFVNKFAKAQINTETYFKKRFNNDFKSQTKKISNIYYAQKAVRLNASEELPLKTLVLLGEKLSQGAFQEDFEKIISENVIKFNGQFFKLDDLENQTKIQKAIRTYYFEECQEIKKSA
jgi:hypothetical protein